MKSSKRQSRISGSEQGIGTPLTDPTPMPQGAPMFEQSNSTPISEQPQLSYAEFIRRKSQIGDNSGFEPLWMPPVLFDFQAALVEWAILKGRAAIFADCGLGKSLMQLVWAENVARKTGKPVIVIAPLAVTAQTQREAEKFGIEAKVSRDGALHRITITNYERLHYFNQADFVGGVADESSAIKSFDGRRRKQVVRFFSKLPYRLLCTATPSPNDFIELGTQSECLGVMTQSDMLGFFFRETENMRHTVFREDDFWNKLKYWFKPHSEQPFWRWVSSWARALRGPADLGFDGSKFVLPPLEYQKHVTDVPYIPKDELFPRPAIWLHEQREERHRSLNQRCEKVAELLNHDKPAIAWCQYNEESELLAKLIPGAVEVAGKHSDDYKEAALNDFAKGDIRCLVTKPKIGCWGMNYQHCGHMSIFPSFSFEQFYQAVRRCWRFGRVGPVVVCVVSALGESEVIEGLTRKQKQAETMFASLVKYMHDAMAMHSEDGHSRAISVPSWMQGEQQCLSAIKS